MKIDSKGTMLQIQEYFNQGEQKIFLRKDISKIISNNR